MDGNEQIEANTLKRIVALLFALADLAERVSSRSCPVRYFVLWLLRRAEVVARDWVMASRAGDQAPSAHERLEPFSVLDGNGPTDAIHLAHAFRALAHELKRQLRLEEQLSRRLLRGKTDAAATDTPQSSLFAADKIIQFARAIWSALSNLNQVSDILVPRLDTS